MSSPPYLAISRFNPEKAHRNWTSFCRDGILPEGVRPEIAASWVRCQEAGLNPYMESLPAPRPAARVDQVSRSLNEYSRMGVPLLEILGRVLQDSGMVVYFADRDLMIIKKHGDSRVLEQLAAMGVGPGSVLSEAVLGTNAGALSTGQKAWVMGAEHYLKRLHGYATAAVPILDTKGQFFASMILVTTVERFSFLSLGLLEYFVRAAEAVFELEEKSKERLILSEFLSLAVEQYSHAVLSLNRNGQVIQVNHQTQALLGLNPEGVAGSPIDQVLPGLPFVRDCLEKGETIMSQEVRGLVTPRGREDFTITCQPTRKGDAVIGAMVILQEAKSVHKLVNRMTSSHARLTFDDLVGENPGLRETKKVALAAAGGNSNILLLGESGTGKEIFAQAIHNASPRAGQPFISINCAALPRELIGSELFGYSDGAFTGASKGGSPGKFELANGGTIFLDEIGEMPLDMQAVLLRVLEEKRVARLGSRYALPIDVRILSATNKDLRAAVTAQRFRLDLYYRLNVIRLELAPLRERKDDIPLLVQHFLKKHSRALNKQVTGTTDEVMALLLRYEWPGNVRELGNVVERGVTLTTTSQIELAHLPCELIQASHAGPCTEGMALEQYELELIQQLLRTHNGNKSLVAKQLGISRTTLYRKLGLL